jgi:hypothetical protein
MRIVSIWGIVEKEVRNFPSKYLVYNQAHNESCLPLQNRS